MRGVSSIWQYGLIALGALSFSGLVASGCSAGDDPESEDLNDQVQVVAQGLRWCQGGTNGDGDYCTAPCAPCTAGQGDCDSNAECQPGLVCKNGAGTAYGLPAGVDVCVTAQCNNQVWDANECGIDCGGTSGCGTCSPVKLTKTCGGTNGGFDYCRNPNQKCAHGEGDCHSNSAYCQAGLTCKGAAGLRYGFPNNLDVCVRAACANGIWDANECGIDCGGTSGCGTCSNPPSKGCGGTNGSSSYCANPNQRCTAGEGNCRSNSECATGLVCAMAVGSRFGFSSGTNVCVVPSCNNRVVDPGEGGLDCGGTSSCGECTSVGQLSWVKQFGGAADDEGRAVVVDGLGNVYITGSMSGTVNFGGGPLTSAGGHDVFLAKFDQHGNHLWSERFGDASGLQLGLGIALDSSNNVIITGQFSGTINFGGSDLTTLANDADAFVAKFTTNGAHVWSKAFGEPNTNQIGWGVKTDSSGNIYLSGQYRNVIDFGGGNLPQTTNWDAYVAKFTSGGAYVWSKNFGGPNLAQTITRSLAINSAAGRLAISGQFDGSTTIGGSTYTSAGGLDGFVAVLDTATGNPVWSKSFGDASDQQARQVTFDLARNVILVGYVQGTSNLGCGAMTSAGGYDTFVAKFDSAGTCVFSNRYGDAGNQYGDSISTDLRNNIVIGGEYESSVSFGTTVLTSAGSRDNFVVKFTPTGTPIWARRVGDGAIQRTHAVAVQPVGTSNVLAVGSFGGTVNFGKGSMTSNGGLDIFLASYQP